jgi:3-methyladenine DNA glycosylase AlkD
MFQLCEELLASGFVEERTIAFDWAFRLRKHYEQADFRILESWLRNHVHDWGACDDLCTHALGAFTFQFPEFIPTVKDWTKSTSTWIRRASAVTMILFCPKKKTP